MLKLNLKIKKSLKTKPNYFSFRDFSARVVKKNNLFYRYIFKSYQIEYDHLMQSGLYDELLKEDLLISHTELTIPGKEPDIYKYLFPTQLSFQSYPFEWSYRQWRKVILAYLTINQIALKYGMILKDATPYNFYINSSKAVMFDTSSFIFFKENDKWTAYKQFCEMFLSPFILMHYNGQCWSKLYQTQLQGIPLNFVSKNLPIKSWFNLTVLLHIHLHAKYIQYPALEQNNQTEKKGFSIEKLDTMLSLIKKSINSSEHPYLFKNQWAKYYENDIETETYIKSKEEIVRNWLALTKPKSVLDLGANTGKFSIIASDYAEKIIALESDEDCVDEIDKNITVNKNSKIFPLVGDLSAPNPGIGLLNKELLPIFERAKSEMVLSLALIHHLYFTKDMSFDLIAELFSNLSSNYLIVEFIPNEDRKVKGLIFAKPKKTNQYTFESFKASLLKYFYYVETEKIESSTRSLMLFKKLNEV
jgi:predicted nicotinamide N-methyase